MATRVCSDSIPWLPPGPTPARSSTSAIGRVRELWPGAPRFVRETVGRVRRAGASGQFTLRADSAFHSKYVIAACRDHDVRYSINVNLNKAVVRAIEAIDETDWTPIACTLGGKAEVAEAPMATTIAWSATRPSCSPRGAIT